MTRLHQPRTRARAHCSWHYKTTPLSLTRSHAQHYNGNDRLFGATGNFKHFQEPYAFTEYFTMKNPGLARPQPWDLYQKVLPVCRHYIRLRYRLMQLLYDCMWENM